MYFSERTNSVRIGTETCSELKEMFRRFQSLWNNYWAPLMECFPPGFSTTTWSKILTKAAWSKCTQMTIKCMLQAGCRWKDGRGGKDSINGLVACSRRLIVGSKLNHTRPAQKETRGEKKRGETGARARKPSLPPFSRPIFSLVNFSPEP